MREAQMAAAEFQRKNSPDVKCPGVVKRTTDATIDFLNWMMLKCPIIVPGLLVGALCAGTYVPLRKFLRIGHTVPNEHEY